MRYRIRAPPFTFFKTVWTNLCLGWYGDQFIPVWVQKIDNFWDFWDLYYTLKLSISSVCLIHQQSKMSCGSRWWTQFLPCSTVGSQRKCVGCVCVCAKSVVVLCASNNNKAEEAEGDHGAECLNEVLISCEVNKSHKQLVILQKGTGHLSTINKVQAREASLFGWLIKTW